MLDGIRTEIERQVARLLEEAERPMRVEEILPHLDPVMPSPNDVADVLQELADEHAVEREGSYFAKVTPVPIDHLFSTDRQRRGAVVVVEAIRALDHEADGEGAALGSLLRRAQRQGVPRELVLDVVAVLRNAGELYSVGADRMRLAKA